jgi:hypothetical protein
MVEAEKPKTAKTMPKGGRKGGTLFPKINLEQSLEYSKKLVSKTHTGPMPEKTLLPGVFGSATTPGKVRASALKQFGLLEGSAQAYKASKLAKDIEAATAGGRPALLKRALLAPKLFQQVFETLCGDKVSKAKIEQVVKGLEVHPDSAEECAKVFMESAVTSGIGRLEGDSISLAKADEVPQTAQVSGEDPEGEKTQEQVSEGASDASPTGGTPPSEKTEDEGLGGSSNHAKPTVILNLNVDPSSDPDKLEKQLRLLRQFRII